MAVFRGHHMKHNLYDNGLASGRQGIKSFEAM